MKKLMEMVARWFGKKESESLFYRVYFKNDYSAFVRGEGI